MNTVYQKRSASLKQLVPLIKFDPDTTSSLILSISPCRSGSTILLRVFSASGIQSYFQPLKNTLRWLLQDELYFWQIPQFPICRIFLKETLGPFTQAESQFNPLQLLLEIGFPIDKLYVIILGREPLITWNSWTRYWQGKTDISHLIDAYLTTEQVRQQVATLGIPSTCLVYDIFGHNTTSTVFRKLFQRLNLPYTAQTIQGWEQLPTLGAANSNIILPKEPELFITPGIHASVERATAFVYNQRQISSNQLKAEDMVMMNDSGIMEIYQIWVKQCEEELQAGYSNHDLSTMTV